MNHPERIIQYNIVNWLRQKHPTVIFHANISEQKATAAWRQIQDRMGFRKGVSDLFFPEGSIKGGYKGLWLELKTEKGKATEAQEIFTRDMLRLGYDAKITYGYDEAELAIKHFYSLAY